MIKKENYNTSIPKCQIIQTRPIRPEKTPVKMTSKTNEQAAIAACFQRKFAKIKQAITLQRTQTQKVQEIQGYANRNCGEGKIKLF